MSRKAVLEVVGVTLPGREEKLKPENSDKTIDAINKFHELHSEPVTIIRYPVGWSTIDPNFLIIKLNDKGQVEEYWVEQG